MFRVAGAARVAAHTDTNRFRHAARRASPWAETAQRTARRNAHLFTPANRLQLVADNAVLRSAARPFFAPVVRRLLNREGERL